MGARRGDRVREPTLDEDESDRLDLRLSADDRPSARGGAAPRKRGQGKDAHGRTEPAFHPYEPELRAERGGGKARARRDSEDIDETFDDEPAAKPRKRGRPAKGKGKGGGPTGRSFLVRFLRRAFYWGLVAGIWLLVIVGGLIAYYGARLPPTSEWVVPKRPPNVRIVSADGTLVGNRGDTGGEAVRLEQLPAYLPQAVMAIEDRRFYSHFGIDPIGLARAVVVNLTTHNVAQGGSTLTQQLAKNLFLTPDRTFGRKVQEVILSLWLERKYSKTEILEMYLNRVYMGAGAYGVDAASRRYFGKPARQVTLMEAAELAGLLKAPSRYAPSRSPELAKARAETVLGAMVQSGYITKEQRDAAIAAPQTIYARANIGSENFVADWVMDLLPSFVGSIDEDIEVQTTVDPNLQILAEAALQGGLATFGNTKDVSQGAIVSLDPSGGVKAMVGGVDYEKSQYNRAILARRQPGSTFKAFVYLTAMEQGLTPDSVRVDEPVTVKGWSPKNFAKEFKGPISLRDALAQSINTVAVRLAVEVGPQKVAKTAQRLGITSNLMATPSIALGTSEVTPLEITSAYVPFANGGFGVVPHVIDRIKSASGKLLYERKGSGPGRVIQPEILAEMHSMMAETLISGSGKNARIPGWPQAGKSGTSQEFRDAWFIGYTGALTTGVWLGNDDSSPTNRGTGGSLAASVWQKFMIEAHRGRPVVDLLGNARGASQPAPIPSVQGVAPAPGQAQDMPVPPAAIGDGGAAPQRRPVSNDLDGFLKTLFGGGG